MTLKRDKKTKQLSKGKRLGWPLKSEVKPMPLTKAMLKGKIVGPAESRNKQRTNLLTP